MLVQIKRSFGLLRPIAVAALIGAAMPAAAQAAERGVELVSPAGAFADIAVGSTAVTPDGNIVCYSTEDDLLDSTPNGNKTTVDGFCARRTEAGWVSRWVTGGYSEELFGTSGGEVWALSEDGSKILFTSDMNIFPDYHEEGPTSGSPPTNISTYLREGDSLRWLTPAPSDPSLWAKEALGGKHRRPLDMTSDLDYGVFESSLRLLPADTNSAFDTYRWTPDGFELVSHDAVGNAIGGRPPIVNNSALATSAAPGSISEDGQRVFFERDGGYGGLTLPGEFTGIYSVYMWEDGEASMLPLRKGGDTPSHIRFEQGEPDGERIIVSSTEQLTSDAKESGKALYRYDIDSDDLDLLVTEPGGVEFLGASDDGSTIVYRTVNFPMELRILRNGTIHTLGTLSPMDTQDLSRVANSRSDRRALTMTSDGSVVIFASGGSFVEPNAGGFVQVYRWTPDDGLDRISGKGTEPATGHSQIGNYADSFLNTGHPSRHRLAQPALQGALLGASMSEDGSRIFFESQEQLVDGDVNNVIDIYEWRDGELSLVSPGTQNHHVLYHDNSADGSTVFGITRGPLIPELDVNSMQDLYAFREGGGFPLPEPDRPCQGDECQGELGTGVPAPLRNGTEDLTGDGNVSDASPRSTLKRVRAPRAVRGGRVPVRVKVSGPGRVRVSGPRVRAVSRKASRATTLRIPVRLSPQGRRALNRRGSMTVRLRIVFRSQGGSPVTRSVAVKFRAGRGGR